MSAAAGEPRDERVLADVLAHPATCQELGRAAETFLRHLPPGAAMVFEVRAGGTIARLHEPVSAATKDVLVVTHPAQLGFGVLNDGASEVPRGAPERKGP